jgi:hypothetical protein
VPVVKREPDVLLVDVDSRIPNLALMKLSAWHKRQGYEVLLFRCRGKQVIPRVEARWTYISCVFSWNAPFAIKLAEILPNAQIGGSGVGDTKLPNEIEHMMPDYELYGCDYSMGYTTRGCIRRCDFCLVWRVEGPFIRL